MKRALPWLAIVVALVVHVLHVHERAWIELRDDPQLHDFATYDAAVAATAHGANPYAPEALVEHRRAPEPRVLSYLPYPPFFVATMAWTLEHEPEEAARVWFGWSEAALLGALLAYGLMLRRTSAALAFAIPVAVLATVPDHLRFGQVNIYPLLFIVLAIWALASGRDRLSGAALGTAVALKFLPLAVGFAFAAKRRWGALAWAAGTYLVLHLAAVILAGPLGLDRSTMAEASLKFPLQTVPSILSGELRPPFRLDAFPNHSISSFAARFLGEDGELARASLGGLLSTGATLVLLALILVSASRLDPARDTAAFCAVAVLPVLLAPSYLFDHHLVMALPALAFPLECLFRREGPRWIGIAVPLLLLILAWSMEDLRYRAQPPGSGLEAALWDLKTAAWLSWLALVLLLVRGRAGRGRSTVADC